MRPICLHGHERPITRICYNREGDLIFTAGKNPAANVWYSANGERLGSFIGHVGVIWWIDVDWTTSNFLTASGDWSCRLWDICTGKEISNYPAKSIVRTCGFSYCGNLFFLTTEEKKKCEVILLDRRDPSHMLGESCIFRKPSPDELKVTGAVWGPIDKTIIFGHESGAVTMIDAREGETLKHLSPHKGPVTDVQSHLTLPIVITSSKDHTAKLFSAYDLECVRTYTTERPINSAAISPTRDHVLVGGGQEASEVTTTGVSQGKFDARFFHMIYQEEFGRVKGHFGPVNSVRFTADGTGFSTGGEDGYVRMHTFDADYADVDQRVF